MAGLHVVVRVGRGLSASLRVDRVVPSWPSCRELADLLDESLGKVSELNQYYFGRGCCGQGNININRVPDA